MSLTVYPVKHLMHRRTIAAELSAGETRGSVVSCEVFHVSGGVRDSSNSGNSSNSSNSGNLSTGMRDPFSISKRLLLALCDLPMHCAATMLGLHKSCLIRVREKFDLSEWPYQDIMRGTWPVMSKEQVVEHRATLIAELKAHSAMDVVVCNQLRMLQSVEVSARMFWQTSGGRGKAEPVPKAVPKVVASKKRKAKFCRRPKQSKRCKEESDLSKEGAVAEAEQSVLQEVKEKLTIDFNAARIILPALPVPPAPFWPLAEQCSHSDYCDPCDPSFEDVLHLGPIPKRD